MGSLVHATERLDGGTPWWKVALLVAAFAAWGIFRFVRMLRNERREQLAREADRRAWDSAGVSEPDEEAVDELERRLRE